MKKILALAAALALLLALFACGALTPAQPNTAIDLASFAEAPLGFDLTDLARFLNPSQLSSLESSLRAGLADRGLGDYATLHFADPPEGSVKIPFGNESGADLSNLNTDQLAQHICGQVEEAFEERGVVINTSAALTSPDPTTIASALTPTATTAANVPATTIKAVPPTITIVTTAISVKYTFPSTLDMNAVRKNPNYEGDNLGVSPKNAEPIYSISQLYNGDQYLFVKAPYDSSKPTNMIIGLYRITGNQAKLLDSFEVHEDNSGNATGVCTVAEVALIDRGYMDYHHESESLKEHRQGRPSMVDEGYIFTRGVACTNCFGNSWYDVKSIWTKLVQQFIIIFTNERKCGILVSR